jgi:NitT/TauT family transport system substrate-binding protein
MTFIDAMRRAIILGAGLAAIALAPAGAETLRVGKAVPEAFSFVPLDIGIRKGFFAKYGIQIEESAFAGDARMQQAMASDSLDIALGSGPAMAFIVKGSPVQGIAVLGNAPLLLTLVVRPGDSIKSVADLKGRRVSVSTVGSLTYWLVSETSRQQGFGPDGIVITPMGATQPQIAALKRHDTDGMVTDMSTALTLEKNGEARILTRFGHLVKDFHIHVIFARDKLIAQKPDLMRGFLKGWFEAIAYMRANKSESVRIAMEVMGKDEDITARSYDELMPMFSDDGRFSAAALAVLAKSYVELKVLPTAPDPSKLYTEALLPPR